MKYHGSKRKNLLSTVEDVDIVLTTYHTMVSDGETSGPLHKVDWFRVVLDEGMKSQISMKVFLLQLMILSPYNPTPSYDVLSHRLRAYGTFSMVPNWDSDSKPVGRCWVSLHLYSCTPVPQHCNVPKICVHTLR